MLIPKKIGRNLKNEFIDGKMMIGMTDESA